MAIDGFLFTPLFSIIISLISGILMGLFIKVLIKSIKSKELMLGVIIGGIFLTSGAAEMFKGHALMANMVFGFCVINFVEHHNDMFSVIEGIEEPFFGMFFTLAGTHFDLKLMEAAGLLAVVITVGRFAGKIFGSSLGSQISHAPDNVKKYLGFALLPTAGVTVGLVFDAQAYLGKAVFSEIILSGVLGSVLINEFITPFLVKYILQKSGETGAE